jgi:hypothetical protein
MPSPVDCTRDTPRNAGPGSLIGGGGGSSFGGSSAGGSSACAIWATRSGVSLFRRLCNSSRSDLSSRSATTSARADISKQNDHRENSLSVITNASGKRLLCRSASSRVLALIYRSISCTRLAQNHFQNANFFNTIGKFCTIAEVPVIKGLGMLQISTAKRKA